MGGGKHAPGRFQYVIRGRINRKSGGIGMNNTHLIADEKLGGIKREYIEVDRNADVGDYVIYSYEGETEDTPRKVVAVEKRTVSIESYFDGINDVFGYSHRAYRTLEPTDIVHAEGQRYKLVNRKAEVGEKVLIVDAHDSNFDGYDDGDTFVIYDLEEGYSGIVSTEEGATLYDEEYAVIEPVDHPQDTLELTELTESDVRNNPRQVIDLIANLARRLTLLEGEHQALGERVERLGDTSEQAITTVARNVETWAQEVEAVKKRLADEKETVTISKSLFDKLSAAERREL
jgi:hypothetical protein